MFYRLRMLTALGVFTGATILLASGPAGAVTTVTCTGYSGTNTFSPGVSSTPTIQTITLGGSITGCSGGGVTGGSFRAQLTTPMPSVCTTATPPPNTILAAGTSPNTFIIVWNTGVVSKGSTPASPARLRQSWPGAPAPPPGQWGSGAPERFKGQIISGSFVGENVRFRFIATWPSTAVCPTLTSVTTTLAGGLFKA